MCTPHLRPTSLTSSPRCEGAIAPPLLVGIHRLFVTETTNGAPTLRLATASRRSRSNLSDRGVERLCSCQQPRPARPRRASALDGPGTLLFSEPTNFLRIRVRVSAFCIYRVGAQV